MVCFQFQFEKLHYILTNLHPETVDIVPLEIVPSSTVRDLGVYLDSSLDMRVHISKIVSAGFYHLRRLRHVLNRERTTEACVCTNFVESGLL